MENSRILSGRHHWPLIFLLPLILLLALSRAEATGPAPDSQAAAKRVVFIRYPIAPGHFDSLVQAYRETMAEQGYLPDRDLEYIDVLTTTSNQDSLPQVIAAVEKYRASADLFITCGWVSMPVREILRHSEIPQLFVPVLSDVARRMLPSLSQPPHTNLSGLYLMYPPEKILRLTRLLLPELRDYAFIYDSRIPADTIFLKAYQELPAALRYGLRLHYLDLAGGAEAVLAALQREQIGAYGGIVGYLEYREQLATSKLPVITAFTADIEAAAIPEFTANDNTVAGLYNPFSYTGRQAATMSHQLFSGQAKIGELIPQPAMQLAFIDLRNAGRLGITIPFAALEAVDLVVR